MTSLVLLTTETDHVVYAARCSLYLCSLSLSFTLARMMVFFMLFVVWDGLVTYYIKPRLVRSVLVLSTLALLIKLHSCNLGAHSLS